MASLPNSPRKSPSPASTSSPTPINSFFFFDHVMVDQLPWIAPTYCAQWLATKILSAVNMRRKRLRDSGRSENGYTFLMSTNDMVEASGGKWDLRMFQVAIQQLTNPGKRPVSDPQDPKAPFWILTRKEAMAADILTKSEAGPARDAYCFFVNQDVWAELAAERKAAELERLRAKAEEEAAAEEEEQDSAKRKRVVHVITPKPQVYRSGQKAKIKLEKDAQNAMALVESISAHNSAGMPVGISWRINENVLECGVSDAPENEVAERTKGEGQAKCISLTDQEQGPKSPDNRRREGERSAKYISLREPDQSATDRRTEGEGQAKCISLGTVDLSEYPKFVTKARLVFSSTKDSLLADIVIACRGASEIAGLPASFACDDVLSRALISRGVTTKTQRHPIMWLKAEGGHGSLVQTVANWASEFRRNGTIASDENFSEVDRQVLDALERTRDKW